MRDKHARLRPSVSLPSAINPRRPPLQAEEGRLQREQMPCSRSQLLHLSCCVLPREELQCYRARRSVYRGVTASGSPRFHSQAYVSRSRWVHHYTTTTAHLQRTAHSKTPPSCSCISLAPHVHPVGPARLVWANP